MSAENVALTVNIKEENFSYPILIGNGLRKRLNDLIADYYRAEKIFLVSDENVYSLYGEETVSLLRDAGYQVKVYLVPPGEKAKAKQYLFQGYDKLVEGEYQRDHLVVVLGGGVPGDLGGFLAATYMRGVRLLQIPTTLLAQVDSSVGGKTAINHPRGKNLIGAFYQPRAVIIDVGFLHTLNERELMTGLAEVLKHAFIADKDFFAYLEKMNKEIFDLQPKALTEIVRECCRIKAAVVSRDQKEKGERALLNFGHTLGHALEAVSGYGKYTHGQAVAVGMRAALKMSHELGYLAAEEKQKGENLLDIYGLPGTASGDPDSVLAAMQHDKKARSGKLRWVLLSGIGQAFTTDEVPEELVRRITKELIG
ncbi:MAG: 3-dehydroquinate synthase [Halanaerobiaceae bacterium]